MGKIDVLVAALSLTFLALLYGFAAQRFELFPYTLLEPAFAEVDKLTRKKIDVVPHYLEPARYDWHGSRAKNASAMQPGLTLLTSFWEDTNWRAALKLIDTDGSVLHTWRADGAELWPESADIMNYIKPFVHGSYLFANGDVVFNLEFQGLFRIDACGELVWRLPYTTHHSVDRDDDGNFWVPGNVKLSVDDPQDMAYLKPFIGISPRKKAPIMEDRIYKVSPQGELLEDISMLEVLYLNDLQRYIPKISRRQSGDILHMNDVEVLDAAMARAFPMFSAGDLLVSLRHLHMVLVFDPQSGHVKWHETDDWIEQHDPDFNPDGTITVYDNNKGFGGKLGSMLGGSRLVNFDPTTGHTIVQYPPKEGERFYSQRGGKWQLLDNGNMLIAEPYGGKVFETTSDGDVIWEWINKPNNDNRVAEVMEATRYDISAEQVANWACSPKN